ncbi:MAG: four helix bundle protein [Elusimicrobiota bacterium]
MSFAFENLDVYQRALKLNGSIEGLCRSLKGVVAYPYLDQLTRAVLSIPLNIAEGNGRWHVKEKRQFFWIARGSTFEIVPIFQIFYQKGYITQESYNSYYQEAEVISKMLTALIKAVEKI